jgi:hypothetical protein
MKKAKYVEGKVNGGLKDGYYCSSPSIYLVSKDTLSVQFFFCGVNKKFPGLKIGDTNIFFFVYQEQTGKWVYDSSVSSHATWYRKGKFVGDLVKESMERCFGELERNMNHPIIYVIDDYLTLFTITDSILPNIPHIPKGHNKKKYCKADDWFIGFPEIHFFNDTIAVSTKAFQAKCYKNDLRITNYIQYTFYYLYNSNTQSWELYSQGKTRIDKCYFDGGYARAMSTGSTTDRFVFYYYNKDHLGNNREVVDQKARSHQVTSYYPFGAPYADAAALLGTDLQPYKI